MVDSMLPFLQSQLAGASGKGVIDLCLDHKLIAALQPAKFKAIAGLELLPDLEELSISMHEIKAATGLRHLKGLRRLDLSQNELLALDEIVDLSSLTWLDLSHNEIEQLDGIEALQRLQDLQIGFNLLQDLTPLHALPQLTTLLLNGNRHIRHLGGLPPSLLVLHAAKCYIHDYAALAQLTALRQLTLSPGSMHGLEVLAEMPQLEMLHLQALRMHGRVMLPPMPQLQHLKLSKATQVIHLTFQAPLLQLQRLEIQHAALTQPPDFSHCPHLKALEIKFSPLQNLSGIADLAKLELLDLEGSAIPHKDLEALRRLRPQLQIDF
jgi:internalin A